MARSLTPKQEKFCTAYIETGNASEAYRRSYRAGKMKPETVNRNANGLLSDNKITTRLDELRRPAAQAAQVTLTGHLRDLERLRNAAADAQQFSAAISAEVARGKAAGVHVEKSEQLVTTKSFPTSIDDFF